MLVTDGNYKHALGIIRSLGGRGHRVHVLASRRFAPGFHSSFTRASALVADPMRSPDQFAETLVSCVRRWHIDLVIPVGFASVRATCDHRDELAAAGASCVVPGPDQFASCADKWDMTGRASRAGLHVPPSRLVRNASEALTFLTEQGARCIIKARRESFWKGVRYVDSSADAEHIFSEHAADRRLSLEPEFLMQRFVPGCGTGYMALAQRGAVVREFAHRRRREIPPTGGSATAAESTDDPRVLDAGRRLIEAVGWHGPAMVEFRDDGQTLHFIEFNPKFWGSLDLALDCGADFPGDLCRLADGEDLRPRSMPGYRVGLKYWWPWRGDLRRLLSRPSDLGAVLRDLFDQGAHSNWRWDDLAPNLIEVGGEMTHGLRRTGSQV